MRPLYPQGRNELGATIQLRLGRETLVCFHGRVDSSVAAVSGDHEERHAGSARDGSVTGSRRPYSAGQVPNRYQAKCKKACCAYHAGIAQPLHNSQFVLISFLTSECDRTIIANAVRC